MLIKYAPVKLQKLGILNQNAYLCIALNFLSYNTDYE
jgi:hypothetical protein